MNTKKKDSLQNQMIQLHNHPGLDEKKNSHKTGETFIIAVAGGSSTCKSTLVVPEMIRYLKLTDYEIIAQDDFQKGWHTYKHTQEFGHDTPEYFESQTCFQILCQLKKGEPSIIPIYNYQLGAKSGERKVYPKSFVIFEGLFAAYGELSTIADHIVYVESPLHERIIRRIVRNRYERYQVDPALTFGGIFPVLKAHHEMVIKQKNIAHTIIQVSIPFQDTINRFKLTPASEFGSWTKEIFVFQISQEESIKIVHRNDTLRFVYIFNNQVYIDFPISPESFNRLQMLNLTSW